MGRAAMLLRHTDLTVARVAEAVGYSDEFAFSVAFKRATGQPPGRIRLSALPSGSSPRAS